MKVRADATHYRRTFFLLTFFYEKRKYDILVRAGLVLLLTWGMYIDSFRCMVKRYRTAPMYNKKYRFSPLTVSTGTALSST